MLEKALAGGNQHSREAITAALVSIRDERAIPLFSHIVRNREYRRTLRTVYETAIEALGALGGTEAVEALKAALYDGEWWAPFRTSAIRSTGGRARWARRGRLRPSPCCRMRRPGQPRRALGGPPAARARRDAGSWRARAGVEGALGVIDHNRRVQLADELLRRFASALRGAQLYAPTHPLVSRNTVRLHGSHRTGHRQAALDYARRRRRRVRRRRRARAEGERHDDRPAAEAPARGRRAHRHRS